MGASGSGGARNQHFTKENADAIRAAAKELGVSPEAGFLMGLAAQCNQTANAVQANPNSPEVAMFKNAMAGKNLPPVCRSF